MSTDRRSTAMAGVPAGQQAREQEVVHRVLASFAHAGDARLRDVMQALTRPLAPRLNRPRRRPTMRSLTSATSGSRTARG